MKYEDIKDFNQRCEEHKDHQTGMLSTGMLACIIQDEINELREYIEQRTWVGLTDLENAEFVKTMERGNFLVAIYEIEKRLKEKNSA